METRAWRPVSPDAIVARTLQDELVLYNDATGSTHHLSVLGRVVMMALLSNPSGISLQALVHHVGKDTGVAIDDELATVVERTIADLAELRLVAPTT